MQHSAQWTSDRAMERAQKASSALVGGEVIWFIGPCAHIRPSADTLLVTNVRVLAVSGATVEFEARHGAVTSFVPDAVKQTVLVEATTGSTMLRVVPRDDHDRIGQWIIYGARAPVPHSAASGLDLKATQRTQVELTSATRSAPRRSRRTCQHASVDVDERGPFDGTRTAVLASPVPEQVELLLSDHAHADQNKSGEQERDSHPEDHQTHRGLGRGTVEVAARARRQEMDDSHEEQERRGGQEYRHEGG